MRIDFREYALHKTRRLSGLEITSHYSESERHDAVRQLHQSRRTNRSSGGFTLIEVLVAATILFITLGSAMLTYQTVMNSSQRAAEIVSMLKVTEAAQQHIQKAIRDNAEENAPQQLNGRTNLFGVEINWEAERIVSGAPPPRLDEDSLDELNYNPRFFQYQVTMNLRKERTERTFNYLELAWHRQLEAQR